MHNPILLAPAASPLNEPNCYLVVKLNRLAPAKLISAITWQTLSNTQVFSEADIGVQHSIQLDLMSGVRLFHVYWRTCL
jgi:hypothetical protein